MLLRFRVGNFRSVWQPQELSLVASKLDDEAGGLLDGPAAAGGKLVPAAVLYGANAAGKSTLVDALLWLCGAVLNSQNSWKPGDAIWRQPFALDPEAAEQPTEFEVDIVVDHIRYQYGFIASNLAFEQEWLYAYPSSRRQMLFERTGKSFEFGRNLKGQTAIISEFVRPNSLFLSAAAQNGHEHLFRIATFFKTVTTTLPYHTHRHTIDHRLIKFLEQLTTGIVGFRFRETEAFQKMIRGLVPGRMTIGTLLRSAGLEDVPAEFESKLVALELGHRASSGETVYFGLHQESAGTQRLLPLLSETYKVLDGGGVLVVDELCSSLHTQAGEAVLALFSRPETNPKGAQLIATTHDTNLLRSPLLRRDQIWFIEKDDGGASHLYPLTDFRIRKGDNLEKGYLQGRFGAVPFAGALPRVGSET